MKGTVVMRFVGNRQEPEEDPRPSSSVQFLPSLQKLGEEIEEFWALYRRIFHLDAPLPSLGDKRDKNEKSNSFRS